MSNKENSGTKKSKGESSSTNQKGALSTSKKNQPKHTKDDSDGAGRNTTKKQSNSI
jgi:hypothetical protein